MLTLTAQYTLDGTSSGDREKAHAFIDAVYAIGGSADVTAKTQAEVESDLKELDPEKLRRFMQQLVDGEIGKPFNDGERRMLLAIAERSPQPYDYDENRELLGSGAKFGNVSSGLARRFWNRGFALPYKEGDGGYVMAEATAAVIQEVLAPEVA